MSHAVGRGLSIFFGTTVVFRQRVRGTARYRDLATASCMSAGILALSAAFRYFLFGNLTVNGNGIGGILRQWMSPSAMAGTLILMSCAAVLGAAAAPASESEEEIQSSLLAGISPFALCTGRLLASMRVPLAVLLASSILWTAAQGTLQIVPRADGGTAAIWLEHLALLCAALMIGAVSFACELSRNSRRTRGRGTAIGLLVTLVLVAAPFLINAGIQILDNPTRLIEIILLINPVYAVESALGRDILHARWIYGHTSAADYQFSVPSPLASAGVFLTVALIAHALAVLKLRRAFR